MSDEITPGERRELRSVVRGQYKVLRAEVKRRKEELVAEVEAELLTRYREQDAAVAEARREAGRRLAECTREIEAIGQALREAHPDLTVQAGATYGGPNLTATNHNRTEIHRALMASIPNRIGDAQLALDRGENDMLRKLSEGALDSEEARAFLSSIPTVGELVPRARLQELEQSLGNLGLNGPKELP